MRGKVIVLMGLFLLGLTTPGAADLVGYWPLNEGDGDQVIDRTGNGHDGTIDGATWVSPGWDGEGVCLEFDGANDLVRIPDAADLRFDAAASYTLTAWVNFTVLPGHWSGVITKGRDTDDWYGIWVDGSNVWVFGHGPNNQLGSPVVAGVWTHVAVIYDNGSKKIYLDGQLDNETTASATGDAAADLVFGAALGVTEFAPIQLNEVRIYNHALNEAEVAASMQSLSPPELATDPVPGSEAADVPRDGDLSWTPGEFAATHDVYFATTFDDVNDASRSNPGDALRSQGQTASTYDPGRLDFSRTYYWRVDEVNAAPDNTIFKGDLWSFTAEPFAYAVENISATSNVATDATAGPENTINGSGLGANDEHSTAATDMWLVSPGGESVWIQYEFDQVYKLHQMLLWNYNVQFELLLGFGVKGATVEYSVNGTDWTVLGEVELAQATARSDYTANTTIEFAGVAARYVRLAVNSGYSMMGQFGLSEVRFLHIPASARQPQPADGQADVNPNGVLNWRAGREAAGHELYLSGDEAALADGTALVDTVAASSYPLGSLDLQYGNTYYWKINEVNEAEAVSTWEGAVWSFATQEYAVVEDFESYTEDLDAGGAIFQSWIDGWDNGTGSTVGHLTEPFAEQGIVHSGAQSMPLFYDNTGGLTTSEADRTFETSQNWAANGIQSLSLYFCGDPDNSSGQLYLKINGTRVDYDGDAADLTRALWQAWNVDLSAVGGNLAGVTTLTIGIEGAGAAGIVYVDDIRLYPRAVEYITPAEPDGAALVAHYALEGNPNDSSGNGYHGTEIDGVTYVAGAEGQGVQLDGLYDYIDFGTPAGWPAALEPRSMTGWAVTNTVDPGWRWIAAYGSGATSQAMFIGLNGPDLYGGGHGDDVMSPGFWAVDEWHHIALTYDGTTARLYADGIEVAAEAKDWNLVPDRAHIGRQVSDQIEFWSGIVDEVRIYNEVLTTEEIAWLAGRRTPMHKPF